MVPGPGPGREKGTRCVVVTRLPKLLKEKAEFWWFTVTIACLRGEMNTPWLEQRAQ